MHHDKKYQRHLKQKFKEADKLLKAGDTQGYLEVISKPLALNLA